MTTINRKLQSTQYGGEPFGNCGVRPFKFETNSIGAASDTDLLTAVQVADIFHMAILPAGFRIDDALAIVSDLFTAAATAKIGFAYVDGVDSTAVPQDDDYFFAALALSAQSRTRANNVAVRPVILPKEAYINIVFAGAALDAVGALDLLVYGEEVGTPG